MTILCYGDSNTYGFDPRSWLGERYPADVRWTGLLRESARLGDCCRRLAEERGISFADAGEWGVSLLFDGVYFSPEGHRTFAAGIRRALEPLMPERR